MMRTVGAKLATGAALMPALVVVGLVAARAQVPDRNVWTGVFTTEQADRGRQAYATQCAACHGDSLAGIDVAPALVGSTFLNNWNNTNAGDLHERILTTMPPQAAGSLGGRTVADIVAFVLQANGMPAGDLALPPNPALMRNVSITAQKPARLGEDSDCTCE